jgi:competence protein ComEA
MAVSPDDRFAGLLGASAERGGWVPGDVFTADTDGEEEEVPPRRVRLPVLVAVAIATVGVLVLAFFLFRPAPQQSPTGGGPQAGAGQTEAASQQAGSPTDGGGANSAAAAANGTAAGGSASATPTGDVIVHVTGAVRAPSVVTLKAGARVQDAVEAAGGLSDGADAESINLARVLADGEQIHIPKEGEAPAGDSAGGQGAADAAGGGTGASAAGGTDGTANAAGTNGSTGANGSAGGSAAAGGDSTAGSGSAGGTAAAGGAGQGAKVDLNTADAATLETLPGVGPVTAEAIIAHRQTQPFATVDDLLLVKGIGPKTFESLRDLVTVG